MSLVPDTYAFSLKDVVREINSEQNQKAVNGLRDSFMYSKSPQFDPGYGANYINNVPPKHMRQFRNYHSRVDVMRRPGSEIATSNSGTNIAMFPNDNVGYADTSGLTGVIDAQYSVDGNWLYAITSTEIYVYEASLQRAGSGTFNWSMATLLYTLPGSETFSTRIFASPYGDFIGGSQGSYVRCLNGEFNYQLNLLAGGSPIVAIDRTFQQNGTVLDPYIWFLSASGTLYYHIIHLGVFSAIIHTFTSSLLPSGCTEMVYSGSTDFGSPYNSSHSSGLLIKCNDRIYFVDPFGVLVYEFPMFFAYTIPGYVARDITILSHGKLISGGSPANYDYYLDNTGPHPKVISPLGVVQAYVNAMPRTVSGGVTTYFTGYVLLKLYWRSSPSGDIPGYQIVCFLDKQIQKNVNDFTLFSDGSIGYGSPFNTTTSPYYIGSFVTGTVNPHTSVNWFAAKLTNKRATWAYFVGFPLTSLTLTNGAYPSMSLMMDSDYSNYRIKVDASGFGWLALDGTDEWERNDPSFSITVAANTTGALRFTWIHMLDGDNGIIISSFPITQNP